MTPTCTEAADEPIFHAYSHLEAAGAIFAGDLSGIKARVLLSVLLAEPEAVDVQGAIESIAG